MHTSSRLQLMLFITCLLQQNYNRLTTLLPVIYAQNRLEMLKCEIIVTLYRGTAHNECNLMYRISGWKWPVAIHNRKGYDGHLIVKALKSEFGRVRVIPQNMEKYLSLSLSRSRPRCDCGL